MGATNSALTERNERVKYARDLGVIKPHTLKKDALEAAIAEAETASARADEQRAASREAGDPFDDIDPELEGDHLAAVEVEDTLTDKLKAREATREAWLMSAVDELKPLLMQAGCAQLPQRNINVSVGFPKGNARKVIGQHWSAKSSDDKNTVHIFISPTMGDAVDVLGVLLHELIHADDAGESGHNGHFAKIHKSVGLVGKTTASEVGDDLRPVLADVVATLGPFPHVKLNLGEDGPKKQTTRMLKVGCGECGFIFRTTAKWVEAYGAAFKCPCGNESMEIG